MLRIALASALTALLGAAPLQCGSGPDPGLRQEETAGDALYKLAQSFEDAGDQASARKTYRFLVEHYPSSRHAPAARQELDGK